MKAATPVRTIIDETKACAVAVKRRKGRKIRKIRKFSHIGRAWQFARKAAGWPGVELIPVQVKI